MTHSNKPCLMNRLFPQEDPPAGKSSSSDDLSPSTLLARLSSPGIFSASKAPFLSSSAREEQQLRPNDLYRVCFATFSNDVNKSKAQEQRAPEADLSEQLKEAFAQEGVDLYTSVVEKLAGAQQEMTSEISDFANLASSMATDLEELYFNLLYPLSTTLCHSKNFPQATIEAHLAKVKEELKKAEIELHDLHSEWEENARFQQKLRQELLSMERDPIAKGAAGHFDEHYSKMASFKHQVERVVADSNQAIDDIEDNYKEEAQAQSMKIFQAILVD
ncbi:hypothetical protein J3F83DRAFT_302614 [Trichoderma novae-zelandiae]